MYQFSYKDIELFAWAWVNRNMESTEPDDRQAGIERIEKELYRVFEAANEPILSRM